MKKVFSDSEVAHIWANQTQDEGRNSRNTFYFNGRTIYSYGSHFPIAEVSKNNPNVIFFTTRGYSPTTTKHIYLVRRAIADYKQIVYVLNPKGINLYDENFYKNIEHFYNNAIKFLQESELPRKRANTILDLKNSAIAELTKIETFLKAFDLTIDTLKHKETSYTKVFEKSEFKIVVDAVKNKELLIADAKQLLKNNSEAIAKIEKERLARIKKHNAKVIKEEARLLQYVF